MSNENFSKKRRTTLRSSSEIVSAREISEQSILLQKFWEERYQAVYNNLFDNVSEFGRYGIIAEYIQRICPNSTILDVGCGTGILSMFLSDNINYYGIDLCKSAIEIAENRFSNRHFLCEDIRNFKSNQKFNAIIFNESLYYLNSEDVNKILARLRFWSVPPHLVIISFYSQNDEANQTFDIVSKYISMVDGVRVDKLNGFHSWTIVCGFLNL